MKQEVSLNKQEVNQAILEYAEKHGVRLDGMDATVEVMATRGDRELFATIALEPNNVSVFDKAFVSKDLGTSKMYVHTEIVKTLQDTQQDIDEGVPVEVEPVDADIDDEDSIFG